MRFLTTAACFFLLGTIATGMENRYAQIRPDQQQVQEHKTAVADATESHSNIDPAKEADIRALLSASVTDALATQVMDASEKTLRPVLTNSLPPGEYREKLIALMSVRFQIPGTPT